MFTMWSVSKIKFESQAQIFQRPFSELHSVTSVNSLDIGLNPKLRIIRLGSKLVPCP